MTLRSRPAACQKTFTTYIRPLVEYNSIVWNPTHIYLTFPAPGLFYTFAWPRGGRITPQRISGSVAPRNKIPTATPTLSRSRNPMALFGLLSDVSGSWKSNMADVKPEIVVYLLIHKMVTKYQRLSSHFRGPVLPFGARHVGFFYFGVRRAVCAQYAISYPV